MYGIQKNRESRDRKRFYDMLQWVQVGDERRKRGESIDDKS